MIKNSNVFGQNGEVKKSPAFGIDLGTTNSCISIYKEGSLPEVITMMDGRVTLPSCVMYLGKDEKPIVGREAYENRDKASVVYSVKKLMGSGKKVNVVAENGDKLELEPFEVSAEILKALVENIKDRYTVVEDVVITVPADFDNNQIADTLKAAKLANLNVLQILREPTAGSLALKLEDRIDGTFLVYDLGGGTFDASLIEISATGNDSAMDEFADIYGFDDDSNSNSSNPESKDLGSIYVVKATRGDVNLGGDDLDEIMLNIVLDRLKKQGVQLWNMPAEYKENLKLRLEKQKKVGLDNIYNMNISYKPIRGRNVETEVFVQPNDFYKATVEIFNKTKVHIDALLREYGGNIKGIVTIGGSTKNKLLKELIAETYGIKVYDGLNPDEAVSLGAAVQASNLKFGGSNISVLDVISHGIGVLADGRITTIIPRDTTVPTSLTKGFSTVRDNQEQVDVHVYSGNSNIPEECVYLGTISVNNIPKGKAGQVYVKVNLSVDSSGSLKCYIVSGNSSKEVVLTNVLGADKSEGRKTLTLKEKKAIRWRAFADKLTDEEERIYLLDLIDEYVIGKTVEDKIISYIKDKKKNLLRGSSAPQSHVIMRTKTIEGLREEEIHRDQQR